MRSQNGCFPTVNSPNSITEINPTFIMKNNNTNHEFFEELVQNIHQVLSDRGAFCWWRRCLPFINAFFCALVITAFATFFMPSSPDISAGYDTVDYMKSVFHDDNLVSSSSSMFAVTFLVFSALFYITEWVFFQRRVFYDSGRECMSIIITLSDEQKAQLNALMHPEYANYCLAIQETAHSRKTSPGAKGRFSVDMLMQFRNDVRRKLSELN